MACGDVLSLEDLQTAKKHQIFEAEVITGLSGGVAGGAIIDYATNAVTGQTQKTMPAILRDIGYVPASFTFMTGGTLGVNDRDKAVFDPVSKAWYTWVGVLPESVPAGSSPIGNTNWKPWTDPTLRSDLAASDGFGMIGSASYAQIRAYTGHATKIDCFGVTNVFDGAHGVFFRADSDTTSADNGGTILVDAVGRRWKRQYDDSISVMWFGAKGDGVSDDRAPIQSAFDVAAGNHVTVKLLPGGKHLLNSYSGRGFSSILAIEGKFTLDMTGAELITGPFFDDKAFITLSFLGRDPSPTPTFDGFRIIGGTMSFSRATSQARSGFILYRVGIHTGQVGDITIKDVTFSDGDIVNAIKAGDNVYPKKKGIIIDSCKFYELMADNPVNSDHSTIYVKAEQSHVVNCVFKYTAKQAARVGCAVELHGSNSSWVGGSVVGLSKGVFLTALAQEGSTSGLIVSGVAADITNAFAYIWSEAGVSLTDVLVTGNNVKCRHIPGEPSPYNNYQGILATSAFDNTAVTGDNIEVSDNIVKIMNTVIAGRNTAMFMQLNHSGIRLINNTFHNTPVGVQAQFNVATMTATNWVITGNKFLSNGTLTDVFCNIAGNADGVTFRDNLLSCTSWTGSLTRAFRITGTAVNCNVKVKPTDFLGATPSYAVQMPVANNKIENALFAASINYLATPQNAHSLASVTHAGLTDMYAGVSNYDCEVQRLTPPTGVDVARCFSGSGGSPAMLIYNHQLATSPATTTNSALLVTTY